LSKARSNPQPQFMKDEQLVRRITMKVIAEVLDFLSAADIRLLKVAIRNLMFHYYITEEDVIIEEEMGQLIYLFRLLDVLEMWIDDDS
jgi:hypothetical protein